jgi:hypothetical protein
VWHTAIMRTKCVMRSARASAFHRLPHSTGSLKLNPWVGERERVREREREGEGERVRERGRGRESESESE